MTYLSPKEFLERYAAAGTAKTQRSAGTLLALSVLAGALVTLGNILGGAGLGALLWYAHLKKT